MDEIGVFTPEQARLIWQDYQTRRQLQPHVSQNYPQRRPIDEVSPHRVFVKNSEAETIPAYACMRITGTEVIGGRTALIVEKPTETSGEFLFNSQFTIAANAVGWAYRYGVVVMLGDGETPTVANAQYAPMVGAWTIEEGGGPFIVFGEHNAADDALIGRFAGGGSTDIMHGIIHSSLGCGYYEVEIATWNGVSPSGSGSGSNSGTDGCDICEAIGATTSGSASISDCEEEAELPVFEESEASDHIVERQTTGTGVIVLAFHAGSRFVPLAQWSDCLMVDLGDENDTVSDSDSDSSVTTEPVYQILSGHQEHVIQYKEEWGCCNGTWKIISRTPIIFAAKVCAEETCADCD